MSLFIRWFSVIENMWVVAQLVRILASCREDRRHQRNVWPIKILPLLTRLHFQLEVLAFGAVAPNWIECVLVLPEYQFIHSEALIKLELTWRSFLSFEVNGPHAILKHIAITATQNYDFTTAFTFRGPSEGGKGRDILDFKLVPFICHWIKPLSIDGSHRGEVLLLFLRKVTGESTENVNFVFQDEVAETSSPTRHRSTGCPLTRCLLVLDFESQVRSESEQEV